MRKTLGKILLVIAIAVGVWYILPKTNNVDVDTTTGTGSVYQTGSTGLTVSGEIKYPATLVTGKNQTVYYNTDEQVCAGYYVVQPVFKDSFVKTYKYEDSKNYCFATKMYINDVDVGYLYTYRNHNNGVSNDFDLGLGGCFAAYDISYGQPTLTLHLGSTIKVANKKDSYGYHIYKMPDTNAGITSIRFESSPTKETTAVMDYDVQFYSDCK